MTPYARHARGIQDGLKLVGAVAAIMVVLEQGYIVVTEGVGEWLAGPISGTDFVLLLVLVPTLGWVALNALVEGVVLVRERRR